MTNKATDPFNLDAALLLEAVVAQRGDPITRFIESLPDTGGPLSARAFAEEALQLRRELEHHVRSMLLDAEPREALAHARWVAKNAESVAYRWSSLISCVKRFNELTTARFVCVSEKGDLR